jgi:hypothetical protein
MGMKIPDLPILVPSAGEVAVSAAADLDSGGVVGEIGFTGLIDSDGKETRMAILPSSMKPMSNPLSPKQQSCRRLSKRSINDSMI